jgi:hypothetical protein
LRDFGTLKIASRLAPRLNVFNNVATNSRFRPFVDAIFHLPVLVNFLPFRVLPLAMGYSSLGFKTNYHINAVGMVKV